MGWLKGARFKHLQQPKQDEVIAPSMSSIFTENEAYFAHVENIAATTNRPNSTILCENNPDFDPVESITYSTNEVDVLLEATFGQAKRTDGQSNGNGRTKEETVHRPLQNESISDESLPFITKEEVLSKKLVVGKDGLIDEQHSHCLWIVVDNIVYDCSQFIQDHPGGKEVILNFVGEDCSWQFWRFHSQNEMKQFGAALRIGRTAGVPNRFEEQTKYVGLTRIGHDEW